MLEKVMTQTALLPDKASSVYWKEYTELHSITVGETACVSASQCCVHIHWVCPVATAVDH